MQLDRDKAPLILYIGVLALLSSCFGNKIETGKTLKSEDKVYIQSLNLLDKNEPVYKFYSEFNNSVAGNFFTDRRMAKFTYYKGTFSTFVFASQNRAFMLRSVLRTLRPSRQLTQPPICIMFI